MALFAGFAQRLLNLNEPLKTHPMTHTETLKGQFNYNRKQVLWLTDMTEEEYNNFQIDTAKAWTERYWTDVYDVDQLLTSTLFWQWWGYTWNDIDERSMLRQLYSIEPPHRHSSYRAMHQYIFNPASSEQQSMIHDFRSLYSAFAKEYQLKQKEAKP